METEKQAALITLLMFVFAIVTLIATYYADKREFEKRMEKAYQDGVARAEAKAAAVGGWDNWVDKELEKN